MLLVYKFLYFQTAAIGKPLHQEALADLAGGGNLVPPPPKHLYEKGRTVTISVNDGGNDGRQQLPTSQRTSPQVARRQLGSNRARSFSGGGPAARRELRMASHQLGAS